MGVPAWLPRLAGEVLKHAEAAVGTESLEEASMEAEEAVEAARRLRRRAGSLPAALRLYVEALVLLADAADRLVTLRFVRRISGFPDGSPSPEREEVIIDAVYRALRGIIMEYMGELLDLYS